MLIVLACLYLSDRRIRLIISGPMIGVTQLATSSANNSVASMNHSEIQFGLLALYLAFITLWFDDCGAANKFQDDLCAPIVHSQQSSVPSIDSCQTPIAHILGIQYLHSTLPLLCSNIIGMNYAYICVRLLNCTHNEVTRIFIYIYYLTIVRNWS